MYDRRRKCIGTQTRDFTYLEGIVGANLTPLESGKADGEFLNTGSSDNIGIRTLATEVRDQLAAEYAEGYDAAAEHTRTDVLKTSELIGYSLITQFVRESRNLSIGTGRIMSGTSH